MFLRIFRMEGKRLLRNPLLWVLSALFLLYIALSVSNFYVQMRSDFLNERLPIPGMAFDLATALDQQGLLAIVLVILTIATLGSDYAQRTHQHWLTRASRGQSLLAIFAVLAVYVLVMQFVLMGISWTVGWYAKTFTYQVVNTNNLVPWAVGAAPFYTAFAYLPYIAFGLFLIVLVRKPFFALLLGLGYTTVGEVLLGSFLPGYGGKFLLRGVPTGLSFLLNTIGAKPYQVGEWSLPPLPAAILGAVYLSVLLGLAIWLYKRQDLGV